MRRFRISSLIAIAHGRASLCDPSGIAIPSSWWHCRHFFSNTCAISRLNSTVVKVGACVYAGRGQSAQPRTTAAARSGGMTRFMVGL
jgi:hypothetical protein